MVMDFESSDRRTVDYVLFGLAFLAFMIAAAGVVMNSLWAAVMGVFLSLFSFFCSWVVEPAEE